MTAWALTYVKAYDAQDLDWLAPALTDPFFNIGHLESDVKRGMAAIYRATLDGVRVGAMAVRIDSLGFGQGDELVIVAAGGNTPDHGGGILLSLASHAARLAKELNCVRVRAHSRVRAVQVLMERGGWIEQERVFTKEAA